MKLNKKIFSLFFALSLLCMVSVTARAHEAPDETRNGTITVKMEYEGKAVSGGTLKAYRVGRIQEEDGEYSFVKTKAMRDFNGSYDEVSDPKLAKKVAAFVQEKELGAYATAKNKNGKAVFSGLELGLYLIVQTEASDGYEPLKPFLVTVPMDEGGSYQYKVNAEGKFQLRRETDSGVPSDPAAPSKPSERILPQTGQLNWPIPVLTVLGLMLFSVGWLLCTGEERNDYGQEKKNCL